MVFKNNHRRDGWDLLPHDILLWIHSYLDHEDSYACLHVCRQWYSVFALKFYTNVTISNAQQCSRLSSQLDALGDVIKNLQVKLSTDDMEAWRGPSQWHFRALRSVSIFAFDKPQLHSTMSSGGRLSAFHRSNFRYTVTRFLSLQTSLTYLELSVPHLDNALLLSALKNLPGLLTIVLRGMSGYLTCADMDSIHQNCPELRRVEISAEQFITQGRTLHQQQDLAERGEEGPLPHETGDDILLRLFPLDESSSSSLRRPIAPKLVSLHISIYRGLEEHMCDWFVYASRNYPHLESFSLEARPENQCRVGEREFEFDLLNMVMDYQWANAVWKLADLAALHLFVRSCTKLKSFSIMQLYLTRDFLNTIFACNLPITSFGSTMNIRNPWQPNRLETDWLFSSTLVSLSLQACITYPGTNVMFMGLLGTLHWLRHLKLARYERFDMGVLLQHSRRLQTLTLEHMSMLSSEDPAALDTSIEHDLHTIELRHVVLKESFLESIPKGVKFLTLKDTAIVAASDAKGSKMRLPHVDFESLIVNNLLLVRDGSSKRTTVNPGSSQRCIVVFGVETGTLPCRWYDLGTQTGHLKSTSAPDERILGVRPLSRKDADEASKGRYGYYLRIVCGSAQKIHISGNRLLDFPIY